eukprot:Protomagalhaensia_sp_Gyna_25__1634@NODE_1845_length_1480_cov_13_360861_g1514_i0_p1_GENE_NODE_1845_length_1480_cov_13_360861_g1514_i0NODE_1845_length_1480_cov_13_360861_g1514_i0_p1_ORF_typecomplete_len450_score61_30Ank_5/PF13857_6/0_0076Ank_5/PF13857_6/0_13Ank_4/PF13637_6/0_036Ank_4/PF13637_6/0_15Ank/PF00023_30/0_00076Ank/PF00023_30/4e02Ank_2/PF12796_7/0_04Ank_2/PF12796_7/50Ank_3/PF13606_6/0_0035_NODE_1845_length_1480_cov_13_360861_g1514_i01081457
MVDDMGGWHGLARKRRSHAGKQRRDESEGFISKKKRKHSAHNNSSLLKGFNITQRPTATPSTATSDLLNHWSGQLQIIDETTTTVVKFPSFPLEPKKHHRTEPDSKLEEEGEDSQVEAPCIMTPPHSPCLLDVVAMPEEEEPEDVKPLQTPNAPRRAPRMDWLRHMLENANDELHLALANDEAIDVTDDVFSEWIEWNGMEVVSSEAVWTPPICLAVRWNSPKIVQTLLTAGADVLAVNHLHQNLLSVLCTQPMLSKEVLSAMHAVFKPGTYTMAESVMGVSTDVTNRLIGLRKQEMMLIARLLLINGVSPQALDVYGKSAIDYCLGFGHKFLLRLFKTALQNPLIYMKGDSPSGRCPLDTNVGSQNRCCTPTPYKKDLPEEGEDDEAAVCTPRGHVCTPQKRVYLTPEPASVNSSMPTCCPSTNVANVKRRGRRLSPIEYGHQQISPL